MLTKVSRTETTTTGDMGQVISLTETAESVRNMALDQARAKMLKRDQDADLADLFKKGEFIDYFKYALAIEVAKVLGAFDPRVQAVYLFEESANPDAQTEDYRASLDMTIHLLARVTAASAGLEAFVLSLDRNITELICQLPTDLFAGRTSFLNVVPIIEKEIEERRGYAALLSSIYARPLEIWKRA